MTRLASPIESLQDHYTVVVIGSGYGGAIAASRLARAGQQVCVLERGREFQPGEYPSTEPEALREIQAVLPEGRVGSETGLYEFNVNPDLNVFKGCGLGGTSLVNANVALRAEPRVFDDPRWPQALRDDARTLVEEGYWHAQEMLKPVPYPNDLPAPAKLLALEKSARFMRAMARRTPLNVNFTLEGPNAMGVEQHACSGCGDCVTGCNQAAKNTLIMNYLPDARNHGAEIYTEIAVRWIERRTDGGKGRWLVHYDLLGVGREKFKGPEMAVSADVVVLGAGSLGSTEILLRSRAHGLAVSDQVGQHFSANGDILGFAYNTGDEINGVGWGNHRSGEIPPVGPCITGMIDLRNQSALDNDLIIEDGSPPGAIAGFLPETLAAASAAAGKETATGLLTEVRKEATSVASVFEGAYRGAVRNTQTFLAMGHDGSAGEMLLEDDRLRIKWPGAGQEPVYQRVSKQLTEATRALGGVFIINPLWSKLLHHNLITVHPLGGCVMAEDAGHGAVNHKGQVFSSAQGAAVYEDLYVSDGSVIPRSLGVNPLLTISALAERCAMLLARDRGWQFGYELPGAAMSSSPLPGAGSAEIGPSPPAPLHQGGEGRKNSEGENSEGRINSKEDETASSEEARIPSNEMISSLWSLDPRPFGGEGGAHARGEGPAAATVSRTGSSVATGRIGLEFTERMSGFFSSKVKDDYGLGAKHGEADGSSLAFTLTIVSEDLDNMVSNPAHCSRMVGSVDAPVLSPRPLTVTEGVFNLFTLNPDEVGVRNMWYRMKLTADDGHQYYFEGFKVVRTGSVSHTWRDTTTLYITLYDGPSAQGPVLGKGIVRIAPADFARQFSSIRVTNAANLRQRLKGEAEFGRFVAGVLYETYGGVFARATAFDPNAPPRQKRPLRVSAPEVYFFKTPDGIDLRLTRYQGGAKGPVILAHGLGVSSGIFSIDTIDTNLVEHLFAHGFDVWLFDYRASIDLPASRGQFTCDDIATQDYPAAVATVRQLTGAKNVQMLAHCVGSMTFFMAMLRGLEGVRSAVCSQVATHLAPPPLTRLKCGLHVPEVLEAFGVKSLSAYASAHTASPARWAESLYETALRFNPVPPGERCANPVCRRITFLYSRAYLHEQLNAATHDALHELFGVASIRSFEHLGRMVRAGHLVTAGGLNSYLSPASNLQRLAIPIRFIYGAENYCFLPRSTELTYDLLRDKNGEGLYSRQVIPGYGHSDCIFGKDAVKDVYPHILEHLDAT